MQKLLQTALVFVGLSFVGLCCAAETNQVGSGNTSTNTAQSPSDPELQAAAKQVMQKVLLVGVVAFLGAVVVAGFALYGAYRKFGVRGLFVVGVIIAFGIVALGSLLLLF
jgi:type IV secretory pathway VirB2 component (pilin)